MAKERQVSCWEVVGSSPQDRITQLSADLDRANEELNKLKSAGAKSSDMTFKYNDMATKYNGIEENLAMSEQKNFELERKVDKLVADMEDQVSASLTAAERQGLAHAAELAERDDKIEAMGPRFNFEDFIARLDINELVSGSVDQR